MIRESDVLQAIGYAVIFRGRRHGEVLYVGDSCLWKAYIRVRFPSHRTIGDAPNYWYFYADSPGKALRLAFADFRENADDWSEEAIDAFERELFENVT